MNRLFKNKIKVYGEDKEEFVNKINSNDNLLIKGDNLIILRKLKKYYKNKVKLIYIDPPYNTGNKHLPYNDKRTHKEYLSFMRKRLKIAKDFLSYDGSLCISIGDDEQAYLKVLCDEIFGKDNFLADIIWNSTKSVTNTAIISNSHTHNLFYFKHKEYWTKNRTKFRLFETGEGFSNIDNDSRGAWKLDPFQVEGWRINQQYSIKNPKTGIVYKPNKNCSWKNDYNKFKELLKDKRIVFGKGGNGAPQRKRFLSEAIDKGKVATTLWDEIGTTTNGTQHLKQIFGGNYFSNPKPEQLIKKTIDLATQPGDLVLDFFAGSGTTGAVAHKMGRQWIMVEQMDYIEDITKKRLAKVLDGEQGGISKALNWQGGGNFIYLNGE